ncbi:MAG: hypothetical protein Q4D54_03830 [Eubacteriales bacterium]|nr:hypothetical protein [Lachnospiraceae bacterium]MDO5126861.1 hypothetical protein [Eubacteriales bacterium]
MKIRVGYITSWRRAIFFSVLFVILIFGLSSTLCSSLMGPGLVTNIVSVGALCIGIALFLLVLSDRFGKFEGDGYMARSQGILQYKDKKRHFEVQIAELTKIDIEPITVGRQGGKPIAYRIVLQTGKKTRYIESERAFGANYDEVDLYKLYIFIQEAKNER